jgi:hypothetical protein
MSLSFPPEIIFLIRLLLNDAEVEELLQQYRLMQLERDEDIARIEARMEREIAEFQSREQEIAEFEAQFEEYIRENHPTAETTELSTPVIQQTSADNSEHGDTEDSEEDDEFDELDWDTGDTDQDENTEDMEAEDTHEQDVEAEEQEGFFFTDEE